jgi:nucleoid-associated protein YgaU
MTPFAIRMIALAAGAVAVAVGGLVYWRSAEKPPVIGSAPQAPGTDGPQTVSPPASLASPPQATAALQPPRSSETNSPPAPAPKPPEFDVVRVEPTGETVVAGRAPGADRVELLDQGKVIAGDKVDQTGQFVLLPPPLSGGDHLLALRVTPQGQPPVASNQSVAVAVGRGTSPLVTLAEPGKPSVVLGAPAHNPPMQAGNTAVPPGGQGQVTIRTAEVEAGGRFFATGSAPPGSTVRLYLNGSHVADAGTATDGKWSLTIARGVGGGKYALRADVVGERGKVLSRAEVPFDAPVAVATAAPQPVASAPAAATRRSPELMQLESTPPSVGGSPAAQTATSGLQAHPQAASARLPGTSPNPVAQAAQTQAASRGTAAALPQTGTSVATNDPAANPIVPEISTATVTRGDSLWRISRQRFGKGMRYTVIYEANASQIRNPNRIYPGQVLVMPQN